MTIPHTLSFLPAHVTVIKQQITFQNICVLKSVKNKHKIGNENPCFTCTFCMAKFSRRLPPWALNLGAMLTTEVKIFNMADTAVSMLMDRW